MLSELHEKEPVQTRAELEAQSVRKMGTRDGEIYRAISYFILAVGTPVLIGTYFAYQTNPRAAAVNFVCSCVLLSIGISAWVYGGVVLKRHR
ncbi:MAG: hypothetical protein RBU21_01915 [FCB group bacterium]|jgi:hypothetical protein|nr:hypothetical protein [FCB group bacterium]